MKTPVIILIFFIVNIIGPIPRAEADDFRLPAPGVMVHLSPPFNPAILKGIKVNIDNPFKFEFILDRGDNDSSYGGGVRPLQEESLKLIKYFLASLTIPENDLWVNLSPYEKDRIIPNSFGLTEMGRDLLGEDYMLKQITASLIYPEDEIGRKFWKRIYEEAAKRYGTTNIPVNTFNKVWIVPQKAVVYENAKAGTAYVVQAKLKVMLEQDYLSLEKHEGIQSKQVQIKDTNQLGGQIIREIVIPEITKEVNDNKNFAQLRQVYNSLILATWYKKKIKDSILERVYADKNKVAGINIDDPKEKEMIYQRYLKAFKKGVYNYIKEDIDPVTQEMIPRKYFSGGVNCAMIGQEAARVFKTIEQLPASVEGSSADYRVDAAIVSKAMTSFAKNGNKALEAQITRIFNNNGRIESIDLKAFDDRSGGVTLSKIFYQALDQGKIIKLDISQFPQTADLDEVNRALSRLSSGIAAHFYIDHDAYIEPVKYVLTEAFRNAVAHGNKQDLSKPVYLLTQRGAVFDIIDVHNTDSSHFGPSSLHGEGVGVDRSKEMAGVSEVTPIREDDRQVGSYVRVDFSKSFPGYVVPASANHAMMARAVPLSTRTRAILKSNLLRMAVTYGSVFGMIFAGVAPATISSTHISNPSWAVTLATFLFGLGVTAYTGMSMTRSFINRISNETNKGRYVSATRGFGNSLELHMTRNVAELPHNIQAYPLIIQDVVNVIFDLLANGDVEKKFYNIKKIAVSSPLLINKMKNSDEARFSPFLNKLLSLIGAQGIESYKLSWMGQTSVNILKMTTMKSLKTPYKGGYFGRFTFDVSTTDARKELLKKIRPLHEKLMSIEGKELSLQEKSSLVMSAIKSFMNTPSLPQAEEPKRGGIDLTPANMNLQTRHAGEGIKFHLDPAMLKELQNSPGFTPEITNIQPMTDLRAFLEGT